MSNALANAGWRIRTLIEGTKGVGVPAAGGEVCTSVVASVSVHRFRPSRRRARRFWNPLRTTLSGLLLLDLVVCPVNGAPLDAPPSPDRPWHSAGEPGLEGEAKNLPPAEIPLDSSKNYSLGDLIDLAERHNPETRFAWERARAQAGALGLARSELYPALAATALSRLDRDYAFFGTSFYRQTVQEFEGGLELSYTVFDFGARAGRIHAAQAELLAANSSFNDAHRRVIYQVEQAYYQRLNSAGQLGAAQSSLTNAQAVQQAAEDRLQHGLTTLPDVLEARSATAQAEYELQAVIGAQDIAQGTLAKALGTSPTFAIQVQPLDQLVTPDTLADTVDQALNRAFQRRPDLMRQLAEVRSANARVKEARAAYYPTLGINAAGAGQAFYATQDSAPWVRNRDLAGAIGLSLTWPLFDGGARKSRLDRAKAEVLSSEASLNSARDAIAEEVWRAYSNLRTAFRQRQSALALLSAAEQSYAAALESYNQGVRNLLDVTAAQRTLAQARSADVLARTQVLASLAELAFRTGDSLQRTSRKTGP
jgi:outer membrane protein